MKVALFYHSLISDWNNRNVHFLRGICKALQNQGHEVVVYEPENGWSLQSLITHHGQQVIDKFNKQFPELKSSFYNAENFDPKALIENSDLVLVHEWNDPKVVKALGDYRLDNDFTLLFHDTHHRAVSAPEEMKRYDLTQYDGVLANGAALACIYQKEDWHQNVWVWHEAADTETYQPVAREKLLGDVVWIGNWGDDERTAELYEYIIDPVRELGLKARFYGVRYPKETLDLLDRVGIEYGGWLPAADVASTFAQYKATIHVPRRFYTHNLPGIPTIRPFEAMACKIPLLTAAWEDSEHLFKVGEDYLMALNGEEMKDFLYKVLNQPDFANEMAEHAYQTILDRHTCAHRVEQLLKIVQEIRSGPTIKLSIAS